MVAVARIVFILAAAMSLAVACGNSKPTAVHALSVATTPKTIASLYVYAYCKLPQMPAGCEGRIFLDQNPDHSTTLRSCDPNVGLTCPDGYEMASMYDADLNGDCSTDQNPRYWVTCAPKICQLCDPCGTGKSWQGNASNGYCISNSDNTQSNASCPMPCPLIEATPPICDEC
jgi:hypothetical protein